MPKFGDSARLYPLHYEEIALMVKTSAVRANEPAWRECTGSLISNRAPVLTRIFAFAQARDNVVVAVKNCDVTQEVGDDYGSISLVQVTRHLRCAQNRIHVLARQRKALEPAVAPVGHDEKRNL